jgi:hypothetical protein
MKIQWARHKRRPGFWLRVPMEFWDNRRASTLTDAISIDSYLDSIAAWSKETGCGSRQAYDMWKFNTEEEMTMFLLKWA